MTKATIAVGTAATVLVLLAIAVCYRAFEQDVEPAAVTSLANTPPTASAEAHPSLLYGRVTTRKGDTYKGRLRWGGGEEAFWGDYFNGFKDENPWVAHVPPERLKEQRPIKIIGFEFNREQQIDVGRPFMGRFGDIARIAALDRLIRVTLKSGTVFELDRFAADDLADGVRVWDGGRGPVFLTESRIQMIELLPNDRLGATPDRLHGTVRTRQGDFTGFIQWSREECLGADSLDGRTADGALSLRFDTIRSIARHARDSSLVTLDDGREIVVDFSPGGTSPVYDDFPPGRALTGSVTTRAGRRLKGRLVYDLDESETTETFDAPSQGVHYTIPFGLIASLVPQAREEGGAEHARVTLHSGEELQLEPTGDLGEGNAGMLIFVDGRQRPEYVPWTDVEQIDFDRPSAMYPPLGGR
jgi:hypothetical protein